MSSVRELTLDQYLLWDQFVAQSPQGGLFHTIRWNQMLCETGPGHERFLPLACWDKNEIQAGVIIPYRFSNGKKVADLPTFGYIEPLFGDELNCADCCRTYPRYAVMTELLQAVVENLDFVRIENSPEIWDIRPYTFESWKGETAYTHLWHVLDKDAAWKRMDSQIREVILSNQNEFLYREDQNDAWIERFVNYNKQKFSSRVLSKRIAWMQCNGVCRLHLLLDRSGKELAMTLSILSSENQTAYLWGTVCSEPCLKTTALPVLSWHTYLSLKEEFQRIDMGGSENCRIGLLKDKLGCQPVPRFVMSYQHRRSLRKAMKGKS